MAAPGLGGSTRGTRGQDGCALAGLTPSKMEMGTLPKGHMQARIKKNPEPLTGYAHTEDVSLTKKKMLQKEMFYRLESVSPSLHFLVFL